MLLIKGDRPVYPAPAIHLSPLRSSASERSRRSLSRNALVASPARFDRNGGSVLARIEQAPAPSSAEKAAPRTDRWRRLAPATRPVAQLATSASLGISAERPATSEWRYATLAGAGLASVPARERNQGSWPQRSRRRTAHMRGWPRCWRKPGKLRPPYDVGVFPHMTAKQGARRGQSEARPPLLPRNCRSSATSAPRTSTSTRWRDALMATSGWRWFAGVSRAFDVTRARESGWLGRVPIFTARDDRSSRSRRSGR